MNGTKPKSVRVLVVDDDARTCTTMGDLLDHAATVELVGVAGDGSEALWAVRRLAPDVVLMDINMPVMDGYQATRRLRDAQSPARVLMLTAIEDPDVIARSIDAGAQGVLLKSSDEGAVVEAVQAVMKGIRVFSASPTKVALGATPIASGAIRLTAREHDVLRALCEGDDSTGQLISRLSLTESTVKKHVGSLMRKLGARTRTEVVVRGLQEGLARLPARRRQA